jgi:chaperonin GroES
MKVAKKLNITPSAGLLLLEPQEKETKTASGIYLPDNVGDKPQRGTVIAVGSEEVTDHGVKRSAPAKVGDTVIYKKWGANEVKHEGVDYLFIKFDDVLAIVK